MSDDTATATAGGSNETRLSVLYNHWKAVSGKESTVVVLTVGAVILFPWLFADAPIVSDLLQGYRGLATLILIWAIFAIGFDLLLGYTGLLSFGHAAFWGGAAYSAGIFSARVSGDPFLMVLTGTIFAVLFAWVLGYLSLRRGGIYFAILTLAFAQMLFYMAASPLAFLTNGEDGFTDVGVEALFGVVDLGAEVVYPAGILLGEFEYVFVATFFVLAVAVGQRILNSPYGIVLDAIRENEQRAEFVGLNVWRYKLMAFIISGAFAGVAGSLFTIHGSYVPLSSLEWTESGEIVIITVLGGAGSLFGPIFGAALYLYVANIVVSFPVVGQLWYLILGIIFVGVIWLSPSGIWGALEELVSFVVWAALNPVEFKAWVKTLPRRALNWVVGLCRSAGDWLLGVGRSVYRWVHTLSQGIAGLLGVGGER